VSEGLDRFPDAWPASVHDSDDWNGRRGDAAKSGAVPIELLHGLVSSISENEITEVLKRELDPSIDALGFVP
jgi:hypothetical protein